MGQYYHPLILDSTGKILMWMNPLAYNYGSKLMEHSYIKGTFVSTFEFALSPESPHYKSRVVWAGDYADIEPGKDTNLYEQCNEYNMVTPLPKETTKYRYIVNHTKKQFVDKLQNPKQVLHPLPLLTVMGNGRGRGDYEGNSPLVGSWARDVISVEETICAFGDFTEVVFDID